MIDAKGIVTAVYKKDKSQALSKKRMQADAKKFLAADLNKPSPLRMVSLVKLEAACEEYARNKEHVPVDIQYMAGLQRIDYVFVYPDSNDLVIAGPAEGFAPDSIGRVVGLKSGRPPLHLDDLVIALRSLERGGSLGCSIDPVPEQLASLNRFIAKNSSAASTKVVHSRFQRMAKVLGMQDVRIWGVPPESHYAQVLVEADYRMKLISLGLEKPGVRGLRSHLSMLTPGGNSMQRWWFTPLYDAFIKSADENAFQFAGQRAQLLAQEEISDNTGRRQNAAFTRVTTKRFAKQFTEKFSELADKSPVFAQLQNLIDLAIVAALFKKERLPQKVDWTMSLFLDPSRATIIKGRAPAQVPSVVNLRAARRGLILGLVGGGVTINPMRTVRTISFKTDAGKRLDGIRTGVRSNPAPKQHPWWWD